LYLHTHPTALQYVYEASFIMNYTHLIWDHTWSLGVEEHFYILLPIFLLICLRFSADTEDPFRIVPRAGVAIALLGPALRAFSVCVGTPNYNAAYIASQNRMDALFCGVLIGYFFHFRPAVLERLVGSSRNRLLIAFASAILISFAYIFSRSDLFFAIFGYSFVYLGYAGILLLSLYTHGVLSGKLRKLAQALGSAAAYLGMYSYSIYLWHGPGGSWLPGLVRRFSGHPTGEYGRFAVYFIGSFAVGIAMSKLVEYPVLRLRDRFVPASSNALSAQLAGVKPNSVTRSDVIVPTQGEVTAP